MLRDSVYRNLIMLVRSILNPENADLYILPNERIETASDLG